MTTTAATLDGASRAARPGAGATAGPPRRVRDVWLYVGLTALVLALWGFTKLGYYSAGDRVGYWMGVAGAVMMLLLFTYPLRKHFRFTQRWGKVKWWFMGHMVLGIGGPSLILLHSTFELRSMNATVAFISMLIVAGSGIVGRFIYLHIHRGLSGERGNLVDLQRQLGLADGEVRTRFRFAPGVAQQLLAFEALALESRPAGQTALHALVWLPLRQRSVDRACANELRERLTLLGQEREWSRRQIRSRYKQARAFTRSYLRSIVRVAQFSTYERVFALWHLLHLPFVYLLLITACFHVFAVHAY